VWLVGLFGTRFSFEQPSFVVPVARGLPAVETASVQTEVSTGSGHNTELLGMTQLLEFALNIPAFLGYSIHLSGCLSAI
jgi:hypothetical protein